MDFLPGERLAGELSVVDVCSRRVHDIRKGLATTVHGKHESAAHTTRTSFPPMRDGVLHMGVNGCNHGVGRRYLMAWQPVLSC